MTWIAPKTLNPDKTYIINTVTINECLLANHNINNISLPTKRTNKFKGVVIHNTPCANSEDDGRQYTAATLNNNVASRTHYYVTYDSAWKNLDENYMNWTCGDGTTGLGNNGCISLEIIMNSKTGQQDLKARDNGAKLAAYILFKNNMTVNNMFTHNYFLNIRNGVTGNYDKLCTTATPTRNCPYYIVWDWENFRKQVDKYIVELGGQSVYSTPKTQVQSVQSSNLYIYKATSRAAMRTEMSKFATLKNRVVKDKYYPAKKINDKWIQHLTDKTYSMLNDSGSLFTNVGPCIEKTTTAKVNIRRAPTIKSDVVITVGKGTILYTFDIEPIKNEGYHWNKIILNNDIAYVAGEYLNA